MQVHADTIVRAEQVIGNYLDISDQELSYFDVETQAFHWHRAIEDGLVDEDGRFSELGRQVLPGFYKQLRQEIEDDLIALAAKGVLDMYIIDGETVFEVSDMGRQWLDEQD